jgi:hypothetical protein
MATARAPREASAIGTPGASHRQGAASAKARRVEVRRVRALEIATIRGISLVERRGVEGPYG